MNIFPEDQVDENFFDIYYQPFKKQIWGVGAIFAVIVISFLGLRQYRTARLNEQWSRLDAAVQISGPRLPGQTAAADAATQVESLQAIVRDYPEDTVTPYAMKGIVDAHVAVGQYDDALRTLDEMRQRFPNFALFTLPADDEGGTESLADHLRATIESELEWRAETTYAHPTPSESRIACVDTTLGTFWLGFYADQAPNHVAAFIENAKAGRFNGTQVYEVRRDTDGSPQVFAAGSQASKTERDPAEHDRDNPSDTIEPEDSRFTIQHLQHVVSSVEMDSGESKTRFQVIADPDGMVDRYFGRTTPFAAVLDRSDSLAVIDRISRAQTYETNPETASASGIHRMREHPYPPIYIRRVTILKDEAPEDGHTFDVSNYGKDVAEPWEADLPAAPTPDEFVKAPNPPPGLPGETPEAGDDTDEDGEER